MQRLYDRVKAMNTRKPPTRPPPVDPELHQAVELSRIPPPEPVGSLPCHLAPMHFAPVQGNSEGAIPRKPAGLDTLTPPQILVRPATLAPPKFTGPGDGDIIQPTDGPAIVVNRVDTPELSSLADSRSSKLSVTWSRNSQH